MTTTLPTPSHGAEYTNSVTGDKFKYDSDAGAWEGFEGIDESGDSMTGTIAYPDMLINGNTLTADTAGSASGNNVISELEVEPMSKQFYTNLKSMIYANGLWVGTADWATMKYSADGINWTNVAGDTNTFGNKNINDAEFGYDNNGNPMWVIAGQYGHMAYSKDNCATWTEISSPFDPSTAGSVGNKSQDTMTIKYHDGLWIAGAKYGGLAKSTDGVNWTSMTNPAGVDHDVMSLEYGESDNLWVGVGGKSTIIYSTDGTNWITRDVSHIFIGANSGYLMGIKEYNGVWVAVGQAARVARSDDGINWKEQNLDNIWGIEGGAGSDQIQVVSHDGISTWVIMGSRGKMAWSQDNGVSWSQLASTESSTSGTFLTCADYAVDRWIIGGKSSGTLYQAFWDGQFAPSKLKFNGNRVIVDRGQTKSLSRSISGMSSLLGTTRFYSVEEPGDSLDIDNGTLWLNPSNAKLSIYHDSDWNQLN